MIFTRQDHERLARILAEAGRREVIPRFRNLAKGEIREKRSATDLVTEADEAASPELTSAQRQQRVMQWILPALTGVLIVLGAQQGEQQRPVAGLLHRLTHRS